MKNYETVQKLYRPTRILVLWFSYVEEEKIYEIVEKAEKELENEKNYSLERAEEVLRKVYKEEAPELINYLDKMGYELLV